MRTVQNMKKDFEEFVKNGNVHKNASKFNNCEHVPLLLHDGNIIDLVSVMPLHVSLGLGLVNINIVENLATEIDISIREANSIPCDTI